MTNASPSNLFGRQPAREIASVLLVAVLLTVVFWGRMWLGGGLIGGDLYSYFFPQKAYYAERLADGELPLWNPLVGHGYPLIAESQTGAFYPFHLLFYGTCSVNTAYSAVQLLHYVMAFCFTWMYARMLRLSAWSAGLAALVFTYGWFPSRICLEWAIIGGAWMPLALWCVESYLLTRRRRYWGLLAVALALQMLPGHFHLAFITQLVLAAYIPARLWLVTRDVPLETLQSRGRQAAALCAAIAIAFSLAAIQLLPTWELKQRSQRADVGGVHQPGYGFMPVWYWTQVIAPWSWYTGDVELNALCPPDGPPTNRIEAHLYFSLAAVALMVYGVWARIYGRDRRLLFWASIGLAALLYTPGWFLPLTQHLPGFAMFAGPGRYGIVTTLSVAILAGAALDDLVEFVGTRRNAWRLLVIGAVVAAATADLWIVSRLQTYAIVVPSPMINELGRSSVKEELAKSPNQPVRLLCPGPNLATLLGVSATPSYLGIGPAEYYDERTKLPDLSFLEEICSRDEILLDDAISVDNHEPQAGADGQAATLAFDRLRRAGVTHLLSFRPLSERRAPIRLLWSGLDRFLSQAWARSDPLFLYELLPDRHTDRDCHPMGRVYWADCRGSARINDSRANSVSIRANSVDGGRLVLTELAYPGWELTVDGSPSESLVADGMFRAVELPPGEHLVVWRFRPKCLTYGAIISGVTMLALTVALTLRVRKAERGKNVD